MTASQGDHACVIGRLAYLVDPQGVVISISKGGAWIPGIYVASGGISQDRDVLEIVNCAVLESDSHGLQERMAVSDLFLVSERKEKEKNALIHHLQSIGD